MSRNWLRTCQITVNGETIDFSAPNALRVQFQTISHTQQALSSAQIVITNPARSTVAKFQKESSKVSLLCGYEGGSPGLIFSGDITRYQFGEKVNGYTDELLRIWARDGDGAYNQAKVNQSLAAGHTPQDIVNVSLKAMQPFGITMGQIVGVDLSQPKFPRGAAYVGLARDYLREIATNFGATWNINGGKLNFIAKGAPTPGGPVVLNAKTGMIGQPIVTVQGILVSCFINSAINVDTMIKIDTKSLVNTTVTNAGVDQTFSDADMQSQLASIGASDGQYRVLHVETNGDTRGNSWTMDLTCIGAFTGALNSNQVGLGYS